MALPARLLWIVDREALESAAWPALLRHVSWLYLRDAEVAGSEWLRALTELDRKAPLAVVGGAPRWALTAGLGAHLKAAQPPLDRGTRESWPLLGRSVHDRGEVRAARADRPDYLVAGPVFRTSSKPGHPGIGVEGLSAIVDEARSCPVLAIGGIEPPDVARVVGAGAAGIAVRSGLTGAVDPLARAGEYLDALAGV